MSVDDGGISITASTRSLLKQFWGATRAAHCYCFPLLWANFSIIMAWAQRAELMLYWPLCVFVCRLQHVQCDSSPASCGSGRSSCAPLCRQAQGCIQLHAQGSRCVCMCVEETTTPSVDNTILTTSSVWARVQTVQFFRLGGRCCSGRRMLTPTCWRWCK